MVPLDEHGHIDDDLPCLACGFNLRTRPANGTCPECGGEVAPAVRLGLLRHRDPAWLKRTTRGLTHMVAGTAFGLGVAASLLVFAWLASIQTHLVETLVFGAFFIGGLWLLWGVYRATGRENSMPHVGASDVWRHIARCGLIGGVGGFLAMMLLDETVEWIPDVGPPLAIALCCVGLWTSGLYAAGLARLVPHRGLKIQVQIFSWLTPLCMCPAALVALRPIIRDRFPAFAAIEYIIYQAMGISMLVLSVWSLLLIGQFARQFRAALRDAESIEAARLAGRIVIRRCER